MRATLDKRKASPTGFIRQLAEDTRLCLAEIKGQNEQLRALVQAFKVEHRLLDSSAALEPEAAHENAQLRAELAARDGQLHEARAALDAHRQRHAALERQLVQIERENQTFTERYVTIERRASRLWALYVASHRLHETLERPQVLLVIEEIVNAIIGSEELAVFERDPAKNSLVLLSSSGIDAGPLREVPLNEGVIGRAAQSGETYIANGAGPDQPSARDAGLTACVPLKLGDEVTGAIAIFRLLPQKPALEQLDHELFELLATQAAMALYCSKLHAKARA
jgi:phosphoglycolate phosphatase-like HAD superfamily hydrolase